MGWSRRTVFGVLVVLANLICSVTAASAGDRPAAGSSPRQAATARWRVTWSANASTQDAVVDHANVYDVEGQAGTAATEIVARRSATGAVICD